VVGASPSRSLILHGVRARGVLPSQKWAWRLRRSRQATIRRAKTSRLLANCRQSIPIVSICAGCQPHRIACAAAQEWKEVGRVPRSSPTAPSRPRHHPSQPQPSHKMRKVAESTLWYATESSNESQGDLPIQAGDVKKVNRSRMRRLSMEVF
jgi:hypothetical protein